MRREQLSVREASTCGLRPRIPRATVTGRDRRCGGRGGRACLSRLGSSSASAPTLLLSGSPVTRDGRPADRSPPGRG